MKSIDNMLSAVIRAQTATVAPCPDSIFNLMEKIRKQKYDLWNGDIKPEDVELVRPAVVKSWLRSQQNGVEPFKPITMPTVSEQELQEIFKNNEIFMKAASLYIGQLRVMLYGSKCLILLTDVQGVILTLLPTADDLVYEDNHMVVGQIWNEETVGTCSHALSIFLESPIQLCGPEHYRDPFRYATASSAPIFDGNDHLLGSLTVANIEIQHQSPHTLSLVVSMTWAIQNELRTKYNYGLIHATIESYHDAVIMVDEKLLITKCNKRARTLLCPDETKFAGRRIDEILGYQPVLLSVMETGEPASDLGITIYKPPRKLTLYSIQPVKGEDDMVTGCVIHLSESHSQKKIEQREREEIKPGYTFDSILGTSVQIKKTIQTVRRFTAMGEGILLEGESGTGKELFAQSIHNHTRPQGPFMVVNCAAIPKDLIESELFGYEGGSFTGATQHGKVGKIEMAHQGTLFLDEVGDMPYNLQPVLLRVLEDKTIMRVGGSKLISVDFQLVTATNRDILDMVVHGQFREDLYYRLAVFKVNIPPLRERKVDIVPLAVFFLEKTAARLKKTTMLLSDQVKDILLTYTWPGNVRQLENAMIYAANMCEGQMIQPRDLPLQVTQGIEFVDESDDELVRKSSYSIREMEKAAIIQALEQSDNNISDAAKGLGISKSTLYRRIKEYGVTV
jgi:transcriptional regulator with PAS, ATPase and Fis domain